MIPLCRTLILSILCLSIAETRLKPVIRQVDHILVRADDPKSLFDLFSGTLELPVAWALSEYSGYTSGGVCAGNVNIEVLRLAGQKKPAPAGHASARYVGIAFEPIQFAESESQLKARRIRFDPLVPYISDLPDGSQGALWTTLTLSRFSGPGLTVFLCEYSPAFLNVAIRRNQLGGELVLRNGGPLGIKSVKEVDVATPDFARDRPAWQRLLAAPSQPEAAVWQVGSGPAIRLIRGPGVKIVRILVRVNSLASAKTFLAGKRMLGTVSHDRVAVEPSAIQGLEVVLVAQ